MLTMATNLETVALTVGSQKPSIQSDKVLIYSMRFCPFADRALIALNLKHIPYEVVNINLKHKPEWYFDLNPLGKVPTVIYEGNVVYESLICAEYIDEVFKRGTNLLPADPTVKAQQKMLIELIWGKLGPAQIGLVNNLTNSDVVQSKIKAYQSALCFIDDALKTTFFNGSEPGYTDYMVWPQMWRIKAAIAVCMKDVNLDFNIDNFPNICRYIGSMMKIPEIFQSSRSIDQLIGYYDSIRSANTNYDFGL